MEDTPRLAGGRVAVALELVSPAGRPLQVGLCRLHAQANRVHLLLCPALLRQVHLPTQQALLLGALHIMVDLDDCLPHLTPAPSVAAVPWPI